MQRCLTGTMAMVVMVLGAPPAGAQSGPTSAPSDPVVLMATDGKGWPLEILWRQLTLPGGSWSAGADLFADSGFDTVIGGVTLGYGLNDKTQVAVGYGFPLEPFDVEGNVSIAFEVVAKREHRIEVSPAASLAYDLPGESLQPLVAGVDFIYRLDERLGVTMPPAHLVVYLDEIAPEVRPVYVQLPVGLMWQATPNLNLQVETTLVQLEIADADTGVIVADFLPLTATLFYSGSSQWDAGVGASMDLNPGAGDAADTLGFLAAFRYYALR